MVSYEQLLEKIPNQLFIGGQWIDARNKESIEVFDPATEQVISEIQSATVEDGLEALTAADEAMDSWSRTAPRERAEILRKTFELIAQESENFATLISLEMGKPISEARAEVKYGNEFFRWFSEEAVRISGRFGLNPEGTGRITTTKRPVGPVFAITPWNFPLAMATRKIAPALAAGCTVVIKPAELTPLTTLYLASIMQKAGLPEGVLNVITTKAAPDVSQAIIADGRLRKLTFTGSTAVGKILLSQASENVLKTSMELGGNAPFIVFEDADIDDAVQGAMLAKMRNIGQACTAANRFLVHKSVRNEFSEQLASEMSKLRMGRGVSPETTLGPVIDERAQQRMSSLVAESKAAGANVATGGSVPHSEGSFFEATVMTDVALDAGILQQEIFGPIAPIVSFEDEEQALQIANNTQFGLVSYVYTQDLARSMRLVDSLETGMTGFNTGLVSNAAAPFGGFKHSGLGREGGTEGISEFLETRYLLFPTS
ncbi:MAG TPA: NAD-dependent succinate-semialdehyde dehydrogenase [Microbacteriaceae bacterium]